MIFRVSEDYKGSFVLSTINRILSAGIEVSITGNNLYASDIKAAIKRGDLQPLYEEEYSKIEKISYESMVVNRTDKILVLGNITLQPWASRLVDKDITDANLMRTAERRGLIHVISDQVSYQPKSGARPKIVVGGKKKTKKTTKPKLQEVKTEPLVDEPAERKEEQDVTPTVWDMRTQKLKEAEVVSKTVNIIEVEAEVEGQEVEFIDSPKKKKASVKKTKKKKVSAKKTKKKGTSPKKKKVKSIASVGKVKREKTALEAELDLDERGRPVKRASDELKNLIDSITTTEDVSFVDTE